MAFFSKVFGDANQRIVKKFRSVVIKINELEPKFERFSLDQLRDQTAEFKKRLSQGESLDDILPEAFAVVRESAKRTIGQRHFDVQLIGGMVLHQGKIAEMKTGEGKTLVATLPTYLNALTGKGVHIVTVNDYLSRRDAVWMGQIHSALGLTVGVLNHEASYLYDSAHEAHLQEDKERDTTGGFRIVHEFLRPITRRFAYEADITYGTNNEFGFDYLRDNMAYSLPDMVQAKGPSSADPDSATAGRHNFAIVDEIDSILIDEARTPLIISAPDVESTQLYETFAKIVPRLRENEDYNVDEKLKAVSITEKGIEKIEQILNLKNIYEEGGTRYVHQLEQALKANILFHRDKDYVVRPSTSSGQAEVIIVDEFTGRLMPGRRWSGGLHQAVEAKEKVLVQKESRTFATITFQNYFRLYQKLAGMTGTAQTSAEEFHKVYNLEVISVPTNKPMIRADLADRIYKTEDGKFKSLVEEIKEKHQKGQPVLVGTVSIAKNEILSAMLNRDGIPHKILNAKNHEQEGEIIAQAGRFGAVTVATNMAGRGVDIILGGNPPLADEVKKVREVGGLHVVGTERHDARRIDNQLRGRAGRQGDSGSSQFFLSAEDELVRIFGGDRLKNLMERLGVGETESIENSLVSRAIEQAQSKVEGNNFDIRKYVLEYDDVMNKHRTAIYQLRKEILESSDVSQRILKYVGEELEKIVNLHTSAETGDWNVEEIIENIKTLANLEGEFADEVRKIALDQNQQKLSGFIKELILSLYHDRAKVIGEEIMRALEKTLFLRVIDELWVDHLEQMEYLRDSVRLRAYGQRDPLVEYKIEGQKLFAELQSIIGSQVANLVFKIGPIDSDQETRNKKQVLYNKEDPAKISEASANLSHISNKPVTGSKEPGRNDPCPCGAINPATSHIYKWKKCGMINAPYHRK